MLAIEKLSRSMEMLLAKADKFEDMSSILMSTDSETALCLLGVAEAMLQQVDKLHTMAVKKIKEQKAKADVVIPEYMEKLWAEKHAYSIHQRAMLEHKIKTIKAMM